MEDRVVKNRVLALVAIRAWLAANEVFTSFALYTASHIGRLRQIVRKMIRKHLAEITTDLCRRIGPL